MTVRGKLSRTYAVVLVAMATTGMLVSVLGISGLTSPPPAPETTAMVRALATPAFLAAGALRLARWHITGESHTGLRGVALLLMGGVCLPSVALARSLSAPGEGVAVVTCVRALTVGGILSVMAVALAGDTPRRELLRRRAGLLAATTATVTVLLVVGSDRLPSERSLQALLTRGLITALAIAWLTVAAAAVVKGRREDWARPAAPLLAAMGLAELCRLPDRPTTTLVAAALTAAVGFVVAGSALDDLVRAAQDQRAATEKLTRELVDARTEVSDLDAWRADLTHDARGTLAGIRAAMLTLDRHADRLDRATADRLRVATLAELTHLEQMLQHRDADHEVFDVAEVVRTVTDVRRAAGLRVDTALHPAWVSGVPGDLATVVQNLLVNVHEHAPGARVTVDVGTDGDLARIVVADDGPGMGPESVGAAFGRGSRGPRSNGSGLGLSIARALARRHGGDVELASTVAGSTFVVSWPLARAADAVPVEWAAAVS